ncbi:hypothetical protein AB0D11_48320 [Streptomyces monashensis]|uniref:hypothetical protein n=1 Tax=Streptomyces monashensis TaxID=1678012 RepID=UPI0033D796FA
MDDIDAIVALQDPARRRLYEYVAAQGHEAIRNEATEAAGWCAASLRTIWTSSPRLAAGDWKPPSGGLLRPRASPAKVYTRRGPSGR